MLKFLYRIEKTNIRNSMLSDKKVVCPLNLLEKAAVKKGVKAAIVNAGKPFQCLQF